ncbi:DNA-binding XRE family transcriptional regulator [Paraperlucidibaca baekdonensis]|uniref:DNA-binding XRE family transcriptional regulator n=2 Tax=Paraperlucidibaca baekdonensis TaxID=748120 RepID=A0A3E0H891_9GAMM|nr:DNA-binding XRE family transcriptional regulator [Paraperlucidibaca baekdonensis]
MEYAVADSHNRLMNEFIGQAIKQLRKSAYLSQEQLAHQLNSSTGRISNIERGSAMPSVRLLSEIAVVIGLPVSNIILLAEYLAEQTDLALKDVPSSYIVVQQRVMSSYNGLLPRDQRLVSELMESMKRCD